jgi:hypothetical protein
MTLDPYLSIPWSQIIIIGEIDFYFFHLYIDIIPIWELFIRYVVAVNENMKSGSELVFQIWLLTPGFNLFREAFHNRIL